MEPGNNDSQIDECFDQLFLGDQKHMKLKINK